MSSDIEILPRAADDVPPLFALAQSVFGDLEGWSDRRVLHVLAEDIVFVAREEGQPAGYVALRRDRDGAVVVDQLFVAPGHESRGVAHRLLAHAEGYAIAERAQALRIVVEEDNWRARSFYSRSGFVPVSVEVVERVLPRLE